VLARFQRWGRGGACDLMYCDVSVWPRCGPPRRAQSKMLAMLSVSTLNRL
jgi:hypothetical protein